MKVFVDTGAFCALTVPSDRWHHDALRILALLRETNAQVFTSNFVLAELYTLLNSRAGRHIAVSFMDRNEKSGITVLRVTEQIEDDAKKLFRKLDMPRLSYFDCTSFALVNTHGLDHVFSFDAHFSMFRFTHPVVVL